MANRYRGSELLQRCKLATLGAVTCLAAAGCAGTVRQAAKEAAPAAVEAAADEAQDPDTRSNVAQILADPEIRSATSALASAVVAGALDGLTDAERALELRRMTEGLVAAIGASLSKSLRNDIGPELAATFADAVDRSLDRALDAHTEERVQAMAVAMSRGMLQGFGEAMIDPTTGRPSPMLESLVGQFARATAQQAAFGFDDAVKRAERGEGVSQGGVLATMADVSSLAQALPLLILLSLGALLVLGAAALGWAILRLRHHKRESQAHEEAALGAQPHAG